MNDIITIVTPSYNQASFISETIESVLTQEGDFYLDYIIIDGNSTDGSPDIIAKYEKLLQTKSLIKKINGLEFYVSKFKDRFNRCKGISYRWLSEKDNGHGDALNKGFEISVGDIMGWLNSDDVFVDRALKNVFNVFKQFKQVKWLTGLNTQINKDGTKIATSYLYRNNYKNIFSFLTNDHEFIQQESTLWKRDLWEKSGGYINTSYKFMVDGELWCRFFLYENLFHLHREIGSYRRHDANRAHQFMPQVKTEFNKAVQWMEKQADIKVLEVARNLVANEPIKQVPDYDLDFLIIDKSPDSDAWAITKVDFWIYSSKRRFLKIHASQNIFDQKIIEKDKITIQKDKIITDKDEMIKKSYQYAVMAEKLVNEKEILVKDFKRTFGQQEKLLEQSLTDISLLVQRLNEKDLLLEKQSNKLATLRISLKDKESAVEQLGSEVASLRISFKNKESQVAKLESIITGQNKELEANTILIKKLQKQLSVLQDNFQNNEEWKLQLQEDTKGLNQRIKTANEQETHLNTTIREQKNQINELKELIKEIEKSHTFRVGKAIIWPASWLKNALQNK